MIVIIDYGMGNLGSVFNMLKKVGADPIISSRADDINHAKKLILPGIGNFNSGMTNLTHSGIKDTLERRVREERIPILGICLGMQLFTRGSEEGSVGGLGWFDADTVKFTFSLNDTELRVPHMGWNTVRRNKDHQLFDTIFEMEDYRFYFVHSYYVSCENNQDVLCWTHYGADFASAVQKGNIIGVQFHPEKSHKFGMRLLKNFAAL
jgi:glutamine amidotransferase